MGVTANGGGCVLCCPLYVVMVLLQFAASQKVSISKVFYGCTSCCRRQQLCLCRKGCAARGLPAPAWMLPGAAAPARTRCLVLQGHPAAGHGPVQCWGCGRPGWVPAACRVAAAGGAVCPGSACRCHQRGSPRPPAAEEVADPLQSHSQEPILAYRAPY